MLKIRLVCKPFTIYTVKYREIWPRTSFNLPPIDSHSLKLIRVKFKLLYILIIFIYTFLFAEEVKYLLLEFATANNYICRTASKFTTTSPFSAFFMMLLYRTHPYMSIPPSYIAFDIITYFMSCYVKNPYFISLLFFTYILSTPFSLNSCVRL